MQNQTKGILSNFIINTAKLILPKRIFHYFCRKRDNNFPNLGFHLVHHCNLKCMACDHFCPLVEKKWFADPRIFEKDIQKITSFGFPKKTIKLYGGEPLLHPQITEFFDITRKYFKKKVMIVTNGILLNSMKEDFWKSCSKNNIIIGVTIYPLKINYKKIEAIALKYNVKVVFYNYGKKLYVKYLEKKPKHDAKNNFKLCVSSNCSILENGKLFSCPLFAYIDIFNKKFNTKYPLSKGLNIHEKNLTPNMVLKYINSPNPLCKYCVPIRRKSSNWQKSKLKMEEWVK
jgi:uncharacterized radical SAM superfamily Fe-S cluster-containing enzyme